MNRIFYEILIGGIWRTVEFVNDNDLKKLLDETAECWIKFKQENGVEVKYKTNMIDGIKLTSPNDSFPDYKYEIKGQEMGETQTITTPPPTGRFSKFQEKAQRFDDLTNKKMENPKYQQVLKINSKEDAEKLSKMLCEAKNLTLAGEPIIDIDKYEKDLKKRIIAGFNSPIRDIVKEFRDKQEEILKEEFLEREKYNKDLKREMMIKKSQAITSNYNMKTRFGRSDEIDIKFFENKKKRTIYCAVLSKNTSKKLYGGKYVCNMNDCYNYYIGAAIAFQRAAHTFVDSDLLTVPQPQEFKVGDTVELTMYGKFKRVRINNIEKRLEGNPEQTLEYLQVSFNDGTEFSTVKDYLYHAVNLVEDTHREIRW